MDCNGAREKLYLYVDRELEPAVASELDAHLAACARCRSEVEAIRALEARVRRACYAAAGGAGPLRRLEGRLGAALDRAVAEERGQATARRAGPARILRRLAAVAALAFFVFGLLVGLSAGPASAAFVEEHLLCLRMRETWILEFQALQQTCRAHGGSGAILVSLEAAGYRLSRGAVCLVDGYSYVHLVYTGPGKEPLSIFVGRRFGGLAGFLREADRVDSEGEFEVVRLRCHAGVEYMLVAARGSSEVLRRLVRGQIGLGF